MYNFFWINPLTGEQIHLPPGWRIKPKIFGARWAVYKKRVLQFYFGIETDYTLFNYPSFWGADWFYLRLFPCEGERERYRSSFEGGDDLTRRLPLSWKKARFCGYPFYKADGASLKDRSDRYIQYCFNIWIFLVRKSRLAKRCKREPEPETDRVNFYFQWRLRAKRNGESRDLCRRIIESFLRDHAVYHLLPGRIWINPLQEKPVFIPEGWSVRHGKQSFTVDDSLRDYLLSDGRRHCYMVSYYNWGWAPDDDQWLAASECSGPAVLAHARWREEEFGGRAVLASRFSAAGPCGESLNGFMVRRVRGRVRWALKVWGAGDVLGDGVVQRLARALSDTSLPD